MIDQKTGRRKRPSRPRRLRKRKRRRKKRRGITTERGAAARADLHPIWTSGPSLRQGHRHISDTTRPLRRKTPIQWDDMARGPMITQGVTEVALRPQSHESRAINAEGKSQTTSGQCGSTICRSTQMTSMRWKARYLKIGWSGIRMLERDGPA